MCTSCIRQLQVETSMRDSFAWTSHSGATCAQVVDLMDWFPQACYRLEVHFSEKQVCRVWAFSYAGLSSRDFVGLVFSGVACALHQLLGINRKSL